MNDRVSTTVLQEPLETLIDMCGVAGTLNMIAFLCNEKASHVSENWQDDQLAGLWQKAADAIYKAAERKPIKDIDSYNGR